MDSTTQSLAGTTWAIDGAHSNVEFAVKHLMLATVRGRFGGVTGEVAFAGEDLGSALVTVEIDAAGIDTRLEQRDAHLRSADFFDVERYPRLSYVSRHVARTGTDEYRVVGDLTIRGITREMVLDARYEGEGQDPWGGSRIAFHATGKLERSKFGLTWNQALEAGGVMVGDEIRITIDVELVQG